MSDHELVWRYEGDRVVVEPVCNAAADANCKLQSNCDCESWHIEHDEHGAFHKAWEYDDDDEDVEVRHDMAPDPNGECGICTWLKESDCLDEDGEGYFEIGRTPIKPIWQDPGYTWKPELQS